MKNTVSSNYIHEETRSNLTLPPKRQATPIGDLIQQNSPATPLILSPRSFLAFLLSISTAFLLSGAFTMITAYNRFHEIKVTYDDSNSHSNQSNHSSHSSHSNNIWCASSPCSADSPQRHRQYIPLGSKGVVRFHISADMLGPFELHYELKNVYQNVRKLKFSRDDNQLSGHDPLFNPNSNTFPYFSKSTLLDARLQSSFASCSPLALPATYRHHECRWNETSVVNNISLMMPCKIMWPCGTASSSFFNDVYSSATNISEWDETRIAWQHDRENNRFSNPTVESAGWNYDDEVLKGTSSQYFMLHQQFPNFPLLKEQGVENEHFIVWMRGGNGGGSIRKLYAHVRLKTLKKGDTFDVNIHSQWNVKDFNGSKTLVLSTSSFDRNAQNSGLISIVIGVVGILGALVYGAMLRLKSRTIHGPDGQVYLAPKIE